MDSSSVTEEEGVNMSLNFNLGSNFSFNEPKLNQDEIYDMLIVGGGPAGFTAALYGKRKGLKVAILGDKVGGQVLDTSSVENYMGFQHITGEELAKTFEEQVKALDIPIISGERVIEIISGNLKEVKTREGNTYTAKSVILATGSVSRKLGVPGEKEFYGRGVTYCAICDGPLFAGRDVVIAGGGNSAVEAAIDLAKIVNKVVIVHRSQFRADKILLDKLNDYDNVEIYLETQILEVKGDKLVSSIDVLDKKTGEKRSIETDGLLVEIGTIPNSKDFETLLDLNGKGEIVVNSLCETSVEGVFAAGDVTDVPYKQIGIASGEGAKAALTANDYLNKL